MAKRKMRIAIGGLSCECCTYSPLLTHETDFEIQQGDSLLENYPFLSEYPDIEPVPILRARALPGGPIDREFYDCFKNDFLQLLENSLPLDGLFLHMHGAAYVDGMMDVERDFYSAIREVVGEHCKISASYDLHGNLSHMDVFYLDILSAYRTAPHVDWYDTVQRAFRLLIKVLKSDKEIAMSCFPVPILLPGEQTGTDWEPASSLYAQIPPVIKKYNLLDASILIGYAWADEQRSHATVIAYANNPDNARDATRELAQYFWDVRHDFTFGVPALPVEECLHRAEQSDAQPVIISDSGDNPTAGGAGDIPFVLERLIAANSKSVLYASIADHEAVQACENAGVGNTLIIALGGKLDPVHGSPLTVKVKILSLHESTLSVGFTHGQPNRIAVLDVSGIHVIVTERRTPFHYLKDFTVLGIDPHKYKIIVVKIGYLVPELKDLAAESLLALSPGAVNQDILNLPYQHILRPMFPMNPDTPLRPQAWRNK